MANINDVFPDPRELEALSTEQVAGRLLQNHASEQQDDLTYRFLVRQQHDSLYPPQQIPMAYDARIRCQRMIIEGYGWLEGNALIATDPILHRQGWTGYKFVTRRGFAAAKNYAGFRQANRLDQDALCPELAASVWPLFIAGRYGDSVFAAFKAVEIAVRAKGGFELKDTGVPLMRLAFNEKNGRLRDASMHEGEAKAIADLFADAIGYSKNPHSHRHVDVSPQEAVESVYLANHLLRIVKTATVPQGE